MGKLKLTSFESKNYKVIADTLMGGWCIEDKETKEVGLWNTGSEGLHEYRILKNAFKCERAAFDRICGRVLTGCYCVETAAKKEGLYTYDVDYY